MLRSSSMVLGVLLLNCACAQAPAPRSQPAEPEAQFLEGRRLLEESKDGEHTRTEPFERAMVLLKRAAEEGHLEAQALYGTRLFRVRFSLQAPVPDEREDYVSALAFVRIAACRGHAEAAAFIPGLATLSEGGLDALEPPLASLPREWLVEASDRANRWLAAPR